MKMRAIGGGDPKRDVLDALGDVSEVRLMGNWVLLGVYERPEKTSGGVILPDTVRAEDQFQGKTGLVVKTGPSAFDPESEWFASDAPKIGDWVLFYPSDTRAMKINGKLCRLAKDTAISAAVPSPDIVW